MLAALHNLPVFKFRKHNSRSSHGHWRFLPALRHCSRFLFAACPPSSYDIRKTSVTQQMPWLTQWNAAIGGPLDLRGSVRDDEVKSLCLRMQGQIVLRSFLLTLLLGIFMFPVRSIDAALTTAVVLGKPTSRTPWILSWFVLWGVHMVTGILAVNVISENQTFRDEDRCLRDMEAYGACGVPLQGPGMGMKPRPAPQGFHNQHHLVFKFRNLPVSSSASTTTWSSSSASTRPLTVYLYKFSSRSSILSISSSRSERLSSKRLTSLSMKSRSPVILPPPS